MQEGQMYWSRSTTSCVVKQCTPYETTHHTVRTGSSTGRHPETAETINISIGEEVRGLSASTSGPWNPYEDGHSCTWAGEHIQAFQGRGGYKGV